MFMQVLKSNPDLLHEDSLGFFRDYLVGLGASVPEKKQKYVHERNTEIRRKREKVI